MRRSIVPYIIAGALTLAPAAVRAHGSLDHDVVGAVVLDRPGAPASAGDRLVVFANGSDGADGGSVIYQRLLLGPAIIEVDCVTSFSGAGYHVATFSGTAAAMRYSFQIQDQDLPDAAAEEIRIAVSTMPLDPDSCWAAPNVSFELTKSVAGSLEVL